MKEGKASEAKSGNKGLVILLCVLVMIIMGLGLGVVMVAQNRNEGSSVIQEYSDNYDRASLENDCVDREEYNGIMLCIENDYSQTKDLEKAVERYDKAIEEKISNHNWKLAADLISSEATFYHAVSNDCSLVFKKIKQWELADFTSEAKAKVYSTAIDLSRECENMEENSYWGSLYDVVMENNYGVIDEK